VGDEIERPVAENGCEQQPRPSRVTPPQKIGRREQSRPNCVHQQAVAISEKDVAGDKAIPLDPGHDVEVFDSSNQETKAEQIGEHNGQRPCTERNFQLNPLCNQRHR